MLSKQITQLRKSQNISQSQLARHLGVSPSTVGMYEQGRRVPDLGTLTAMSRLFCVSLDYLITGENFAQKRPQPPEELQFPLSCDILTPLKETRGILMMITDRKVIGSRLCAMRKKRGLTQADVAAAANMSGRAYADIERGDTNMHVDTMLHICQALCISPNEIFMEECDSAALRHQELLQYLSSCTHEDIEKVRDLLDAISKLI